MKFHQIFFISAILCATWQQSSATLKFIEAKYPLIGAEPLPGAALWPKPQFVGESSKNVSYLTSLNLEITTNLKVDCDIISENIKLYKNILFPPRIFINTNFSSTSDRILFELNIELTANEKCPDYPDSNMDESYELRILNGIAKLKANTVWGALRGMDTFSQLTFFTSDNKLAINESTIIRDYPRFQYRGLLLDTARHFIPVPILKKQIDAMAYNKLNVLHWHIVDDQSFPFESLKYPNLTKKGKYSNAHVYKQSEIREVIKHARLRGIRVIPEFDSPGHVDAFGKTFPQFITVCWKDNKPYQAIYSVQAEAEILNPTIEELYPVIKDVLNEFKSVFPDEYIHLGNDEVYYECWKSNPNISDWMRRMNYTEYNQLEAYYSTRLLDIAKQIGKKVTVWQDVDDNGVQLDKSAIIQIWKDTSIIDHHKKWYEYLSDITARGHTAILSSPWYINFVSYGYQEWYKYYQVDPLTNFTGTPEQAKLILGGEAALWSEYVDGTNIASRLWPRASAIAERLWSSSSVNDTEEAKFRLDKHRCRLLRRGVPATPVLNGFCGDYEYGMENSVVYEPVFNYNWPIKNNAAAAISKLTFFSCLVAVLQLSSAVVFLMNTNLIFLF